MGIRSEDRLNLKEQGISLLEFAIILPVIFLLVAGLIDYGQLIREMNTLSLVARDAARTAASHARVARNSTPGEVQVPCDNAASSLNSLACNAPVTQLAIRQYDPGDTVHTPDSVALAAKKAACLGIQSAKLDAANFDVTPSIVDNDYETPGDSTSFAPQEIRLHIQIKPGARNCLLCWGNLLAGVPLQADSVFVLEDRCR